MNPFEILQPEQRRPSKAYLANSLRKAVFSWREQGYPGTTSITKRLLEFWFNEDHIIDGEPFVFWYCQREAIETLIYVYEVIKKHNFIDLARDFGAGPIQGYDPSYDQYPLYAFKMATGSGKTFVMTLTIVWSYFNFKIGKDKDYTSKFLLIAGEKNVIYDRLCRDFRDGKIFGELPLIPPEWQDEFTLKSILKEDPIHVLPEDVLFLTNIQQLEDRKTKKKETEEYVDKVYKLPTVYNVSNIYQENRIREVLLTCPNVMILKDEAHHIYHFEKAWKQILLRLNKNLASKYGQGINMECDFSATPKTESGALFPWIIEDFSLKEAIEMNIVKLPLKGTVVGAEEVASTKAVERYRSWIDAGIRRWREYKKALKPLSKKPILFFQCPENKEADEIFKYVNSAVPDLKDKILLIHTDSTGEIKKADLPKAREYAKNIDEPDAEKNPYEAIVSTLMLNEGWDVRNVNVIVGLRSYTSKRQVLPEQVIGRGLRKMFPEEVANSDQSINVLDVIGPPGLIELLEELETQEGIKFAEFDVDKSIELTTIFVDKNKLNKDIELPILTPRVAIGELIIDPEEIDQLPSLKISLENKVLEVEYIAVDMLKGMEVIRRKWDLPVPQDAKSVIAYYANQILIQLGIGGAFAKFYPIVKQYVTEKLFTDKVVLEDPRVLFKLSSIEIQEKLINLFVSALRDKTFNRREPIQKNIIKLSDTSAFVWSRLVYPANKCIYNYVPCDSNFEVDFAKFLDNAGDVESFTKIVVKNGFYVEYISCENHIRLYYPDFVIKLKNGAYWIIETKGLVDLEVPLKDKRMTQWCEDVSNLTTEKWSYIRVNQEDFEKHKFYSINELVLALN
jgi:type III restriction enzyme